MDTLPCTGEGSSCVDPPNNIGGRVPREMFHLGLILLTLANTLHVWSVW